MNDNSFILCLIVLAIACSGEPDFIDSLASWLRCNVGDCAVG